MKLFVRLAMLLVTFSALSHPAAPVSADGEFNLQFSELDVGNYPQVKFVVTVLDRSGRTVANINPQDFSVTARGKNVPVASVQSLTEARIGVSSLLVIDTSGSMAGAAIVAARDSAALFLDSQTSIDEVALMTFADGVSVVGDYTTNFASLRAALPNLTARGNTALYEAVARAAEKAGTRRGERRFVILVSDGADFGGLSRTSRQQSLDAARQAGVPFFVLGLGSEIDRAYLEQLAFVSGGRLFLAPTAAQLRSLYQEIIQIVRTQYVVTLDLRHSDLEGDIVARVTARSGQMSGSGDLPISLPVQIARPLEPTAPAPAPPGKSPTWLLLFLPLLLIPVGVVVLRRRLSASRAYVPYAGTAPIFDTAHRPVPNRPSERRVYGQLLLPDGDRLSLSGEVVKIGTGADCEVQLPLEEAQFGQSPIRLWRSNGRFVLHDLAPRPRARINGRPASWSFLASGDAIDVMGIHLAIELDAPQEADSNHAGENSGQSGQ